MLQGGMDVRDSITETLAPYRYSYSTAQLPSDDAIRNFLKYEAPTLLKPVLDAAKQPLPEEADDIAKQQHKRAINKAIGEMDALEHFLHTVTKLYRYDPKLNHLTPFYYEQLGHLARIRTSIDPAHHPYFYKPGYSIFDSTYWLSPLLDQGYNNILNLEKTGLHMPPQFKLAMMLGLDAKAKPSLIDDTQRNEMIRYILRKYPFYRHFFLRNSNRMSVEAMLAQLVHPTPNIVAEWLRSMPEAERLQIVGKDQDPSDPRVQEKFSSSLTSLLFNAGIPYADAQSFFKQALYSNESPRRISQDSEEATSPGEEEDSSRWSTTPKQAVVRAMAADLCYKSAKYVLFEIMRAAQRGVLRPDTAQRALDGWYQPINVETPAKSIDAESLKKFANTPLGQQFIERKREELKAPYTSDYQIEKLVKMGFADVTQTAKFLMKYPDAAEAILPTGLYSMEEVLERAKKLRKLEKLRELQDEDLTLKGEKHGWEPAKRPEDLEIEGESEEDLDARIQQTLQQVNDARAEKGQSARQLGLNETENPLTPQKDQELLDELIASGDVTHTPLSQAANGRFLEMALQIGQAMHLDPEVVKHWADLVQVYQLNTTAFQNEWSDRKMAGYDTLQDLKFMGAFTPKFSKEQNEFRRLPAIILNTPKIKAQHNDMRLFRMLGIPTEASIDAVMAHEIAHALNWTAMGGRFVEEFFPPKNLGRAYLQEYVEMVARVYGNLPLWANALEGYIDKLRDSDLIQRAVTEEITESLLTHEASRALGMLDPVEEFKRMRDGFFPYNKATDPIAAMNKRVDRAKEMVIDNLIHTGEQRKREILLSVIKQINDLEAQIAGVSDAMEGSPEEAKARELKEELAKLQEMKRSALRGGYNHDITTAIKNVVIQFVTKDLAQLQETVNAEDWKPPFTMFVDDPRNRQLAHEEGAEPMTYHEVQGLSNTMLDYTMGPRGGKMLNEPKSFEMSFAPYTPEYKEHYKTKINPMYQAALRGEEYTGNTPWSYWNSDEDDGNQAGDANVSSTRGIMRGLASTLGPRMIQAWKKEQEKRRSAAKTALPLKRWASPQKQEERV